MCTDILSVLACKMVTDDGCKYTEIDSSCSKYDDYGKDCTTAFNKEACQPNKTNDQNKIQQCTWKVESDFKNSYCTRYNPSKCEGDEGRSPLKYICELMDQKC
jgi:hypothetical protein